VMPDYLRPLGEIEVVGAFRRVIADVEVDHEAQMMCTVLGDIPQDEPQEQEDVFVFTRSEDSCWHDLPSMKEKFRVRAGQLEEALKEALKGLTEPPSDLIERVINRLCQKPDKTPGQAGGTRFEEPGPARPGQRPGGVNFTSETPVRLVREMFPGRESGNFRAGEWLLARRAVKMTEENEKERKKRLKKAKQARKTRSKAVPAPGTGSGKGKEPPLKWHPARILAIVLGNVLQNARALVSVREDMAAMGIPLRAWLIGGNGRLFNLWGEETYEPIFTREYLERVATEMWRLSTRVFGQSLFTYQNLADALRDPDVGRVRRAVRRLEVVTRPGTVEGNGQAAPQGDHREAIQAGDKRWRWVCGEAHGGGDSRCCDAVLLDDVVKKIMAMGSPA
jgi:hypothetical protein